jgi:CD109 antigen
LTAVARALDYIEKQANSYDEPYLIASYALASFSAGEKSRVSQSLERLRKLEHREGNFSYWALETNTPFYGWGLTGRIETTALALQAFEKASENNTAEDPLVSRGLLFLLRNQDRLGIWFSTQATVNVLDALRSLTDRKKSGSPPDNVLQANSVASILIDGHQVFTIDLPGPDELTAPVTADLSKVISPGTHHLEISRGLGSAEASVQLVTDYYVPWVHTAKDEDFRHEDKSSDTLRLRVQYDKQSAKVSEGIRCSVEAERIGFRGYGMMLVEIGLPPGAEVDRNSIETAMKESGWDINQYEVLPDRLVIYLWPHAGGTKFSFTFKMRFGLRALTPPSTLYDYYNPEAQAVVEPTLFFVN